MRLLRRRLGADVVVDNDEDEDGGAQDVGRHGQLHICNHGEALKGAAEGV